MSKKHQNRISPSVLTVKRLIISTILAAAGSSLSTTAIAANEDTTYDFYGFVQLDAIYDFNRMDPAWKDSLRPSKICSGEAGCGSDGETVYSVRQTRFGLSTVTQSDIGEIKGKLEFELYGVGSDEGKTTPRLRHAYFEVGGLLAGQTWSNFMDIDVFPNSIEYWGPPGMVFWRNIQLRWTPMRDKHSSFSVALEQPSAAIDQGKGDPIDPTITFNGKTEFPDLSARWRMDGDWGHAQVAGIVRSLGYDSNVAGGEPSGSETGYGINLSGSLKTGDKGTVKAQLAYGDAIASYFNDGGIDVAASGTGAGPETLSILGWLLFYDYSWNNKYSSSIGWGGVDQDNTAAQAGDAFTASQYGLVNLLYTPVKVVMFGGELQYGEYEHKDGTKLDDTRMQFSAKYMF
jgi:hypothetical protein